MGTQNEMRDEKRRIFFLTLPWILLLPALLINLSLNPLLADEPIRALIAQEMLDSGNYIVPTINGEFYYNKPPLFNWILAGLFTLTGSMEEWVVRMPTIISLIVFTISILLIFRKQLGNTNAFLIAFATLTSGRILFYDSFLGLIDSFFSLVVFLNFMAVYHFTNKEKWLELFLYSYILTAIAFMLKGMPAIIFQGGTLLAVLISEKKIRKLFLWQHIAGGLVFIFLISIYYYFYFRENPDPGKVFSTLWKESSKRTISETSWVNSIVHITTFPLQLIFHFLPFTILALLAFRRKTITLLKENSFLRACVLILLFNISVYWLSPETRPRYLFMFLPLIFAVPVYLYSELRRSSIKRIIEGIFGVICLIVVPASFAPFFIFPDVMIDAWLLIECIILCITLTALAWAYLQYKSIRLIIFVSVLLVVRIGFDLFVFPHRQLTMSDVQYKKYAIEVGKITKGKDLYVMTNVPLNETLSFYMTRERHSIVRKTDRLPASGDYMIILQGDYKKYKALFNKIYSFHTIYDNTPLLLLQRKVI